MGGVVEGKVVGEPVIMAQALDLTVPSLVFDIDSGILVVSRSFMRTTSKDQLGMYRAFKDP